MTLTSLLTACASKPSVPVVEKVELNRFMGKWYVIASIPTMIEKTIYNATETYTLNKDGTIDTEFTFRDGSFDGAQKKYNPKGFVRADTNNAVWGMQFIWPIKAEYVISYLDEDYQQTIIARSSLDYVWLMARTPSITEESYNKQVERIRAMGYDTSKLVKVPQRWEYSGCGKT